MTMKELSKEVGVNRSTICRMIKRDNCYKTDLIYNANSRRNELTMCEDSAKLFLAKYKRV